MSYGGSSFSAITPTRRHRPRSIRGSLSGLVWTAVDTAGIEGPSSGSHGRQWTPLGDLRISRHKASGCIEVSHVIVGSGSQATRRTFESAYDYVAGSAFEPVRAGGAEGSGYWACAADRIGELSHNAYVIAGYRYGESVCPSFPVELGIPAIRDVGVLHEGPERVITHVDLGTVLDIGYVPL